MNQPTDYEYAPERKENAVTEAAAIVDLQYKLDCYKRSYDELCGVIYREWTGRKSDAETVRRFLAKAYGDDHPAMVAFRNIMHGTPRTLHGTPRTLHGDFGVMVFTKKQDYASFSHWGLACSD